MSVFLTVKFLSTCFTQFYLDNRPKSQKCKTLGQLCESLYIAIVMNYMSDTLRFIIINLLVLIPKKKQKVIYFSILATLIAF